jgi:hypothetical protein
MTEPVEDDFSGVLTVRGDGTQPISAKYLCVVAI